jgi:hypothetical protein
VGALDVQQSSIYSQLFQLLVALVMASLLWIAFKRV